MKIIREFGIILLISFVGEILNDVIPLPVPASIYGLVILLVCLCTGIIRLEHIDTTSRFLIEIMPLMFIPAGVGLMDAWGVLQPVLVPVTVITFISTILVMGISGRVTQAIEKKNGEKDEKGDEI